MVNSAGTAGGTRWSRNWPLATQLRGSPSTLSMMAANPSGSSLMPFSTSTWKRRSAPAPPRTAPSLFTAVKVPAPGSITGAAAVGDTAGLGGVSPTGLLAGPATRADPDRGPRGAFSQPAFHSTPPTPAATTTSTAPSRVYVRQVAPRRGGGGAVERRRAGRSPGPASCGQPTPSACPRAGVAGHGDSNSGGSGQPVG